MPQYNITSGLPQLPVASDKMFKELSPIYNAVNALAKPIAELKGQVTFSQAELQDRNPIASLTSQYHNRAFVKAVEDLVFGAIVSLTVDGGKLAARKASAFTPIYPAHGIVAEIQGISTGAFGEITLMQGYSAGIAGTAVGQFYWLGANGLVQSVPPSVAGDLVQGVGIGLGSAGFYLAVDTNPKLV